MVDIAPGKFLRVSAEGRGIYVGEVLGSAVDQNIPGLIPFGEFQTRLTGPGGLGVGDQVTFGERLTPKFLRSAPDKPERFRPATTTEALVLVLGMREVIREEAIEEMYLGMAEVVLKEVLVPYVVDSNKSVAADRYRREVAIIEGYAQFNRNPS